MELGVCITRRLMYKIKCGRRKQIVIDYNTWFKVDNGKQKGFVYVASINVGKLDIVAHSGFYASNHIITIDNFLAMIGYNPDKTERTIVPYFVILVGCKDQYRVDDTIDIDIIDDHNTHIETVSGTITNIGSTFDNTVYKVTINDRVLYIGYNNRQLYTDERDKYTRPMFEKTKQCIRIKGKIDNSNYETEDIFVCRD